ncbi:MAG: glycoside hydrolase family 9 protein [Phycisphaerales bacterium]|nr:glycoside hydrolase family 9 protein [Phycisphaerales bacterium]
MPIHWMQMSGLAALAIFTSGAWATCPDTDGNGQVDVTDLLAVVDEWGPCSGCGADVNDSGAVDVMDMLLVLDAWGACDDEPDQGDGPHNYGEALQKALTFYAAQRSGDLPDDYVLDWRGDCFDYEFEQINGEYPHDPAIINRYMDAGDTPTFVLPISSAMTTMAWSALDFPGGYENAGLKDDLERVLRWHADWCVAAHPQPNVFCGQIGQGDASHAFWGPPEVHTQADGYRPRIWWLSPDYPGSEPAAESAAFLAASSMLFSDTEPGYASVLLQHARELYAFADTHRGTYTSSIPEVVSFYNSWSGYHDELCWAAAWLYRATGEQDYLDRAEAHYAQVSPDPNWSQSWDGKVNGASVLLAALTGKQVYRDYVEQHLGYFLPGGGIAYTPGGLAWLDQWGSLRYAANTAFIAFAYVQLVGDHPDGRYATFGEQQINYILGSNPRNSSYVCGFGQNPPTRPHHRGAHGSWDNQINDPGPNRHVLWGALVGGPASADDFDYVDVRSDYIANEVACDYNAGFTAALGRMSMMYGGDALPDAVFPPAEDSYGQEMFVEASVIEDGDTSTRLRCMLNNRSAWPARMSEALSYRIYLDLTEVLEAGYGPGDVIIDSGFVDGGVVGPLQVANPSSNLYYVEIAYPGELIGPGPGTLHRRECQISLGLPGSAPASAWDSSNDPSIAGLPFGLSAIVKTEMIPVYDAGEWIYGEEGTLDCNDNGIADGDEVADGSALDLDGNGVPDECDPDCDEDGEPDAYELQQGTAEDCNLDGIPDGCQGFADCNGNGTGDPCDLADGSAVDCNNNGIPDSCDIQGGGSEDQEGDGIPDECQVQGLVYHFQVEDQWEGGFTASLAVDNNTGETISGWTLEFDVPYALTGLWPVGEALWSQDANGHVTVQSEAWNGVVPDGGTLEIGFQASAAPAPPMGVLLNGSVVDPAP